MWCCKEQRKKKHLSLIEHLGCEYCVFYSGNKNTRLRFIQCIIQILGDRFSTRDDIIEDWWCSGVQNLTGNYCFHGCLHTLILVPFFSYIMRVIYTRESRTDCDLSSTSRMWSILKFWLRENDQLLFVFGFCYVIKQTSWL